MMLRLYIYQLLSSLTLLKKILIKHKMYNETCFSLVKAKQLSVRINGTALSFEARIAKHKENKT